MAKYAVGYANFYDNDLAVEVIEAYSIRAAIINHSKLFDEHATDHEVPDSIDDIKQYFFDKDILVGAVLIE